MGGEGAGTHNILWSVFPLPCLASFTSYHPLVLSKPQRALGEPFPIKAKGSPNNSSEEEEGGHHSRSRAWESEDTGLQTELWSEVPTQHGPHLLSMVSAMPQSPGSSPSARGSRGIRSSSAHSQGGGWGGWGDSGSGARS